MTTLNAPIGAQRDQIGQRLIRLAQLLEHGVPKSSERSCRRPARESIVARVAHHVVLAGPLEPDQRLPGFGTATVWSSRPFTAVKSAVLAPMPSASEIRTTAVQAFD